jgi:sulfotransferase family protein
MAASDSTVSSPRIMGATGGSGTRVVARVARRAGLFIGTNLNPAEDSLDVAEYYDRWINPYYWHDHGWGPDVEGEMRTELVELLDRHREGSDGAPWGWKEPRSIFLVSFLARALPGLRLLHVVRDGRDLAFSKNQNQPRKHADAFLGTESSLEAGAPARSIELWNAVNLRAADAAEAELGQRYLRIRYEDLCAEPEPVIENVLGFLELEGDSGELAAEVEPPPTLGRWREADRALVAELERIATPALRRFGYLDG